jgi:phosphatidate cytidylyltransferase
MLTPEESIARLFAGLFAVLTIASLVGAWLAARSGPAGPSDSISNLNARIKAWWVMILVMVPVFWLGEIAVLALFAVISLQCLREYFSLVSTRRADHRSLLVVFYVLLPLQYLAVGLHRELAYLTLILVAGFLLLPFIGALAGECAGFLGRAAIIQWGLLLCVYCLSFVPALLDLNIPGYQGRNILLVGFVLLTVQSGDVLQYIWGKLFGKRRPFPAISPGKTLAGLLGGVGSASLLGAALWWITPFSPVQAAAMALLVNLAGVGGGLVLSAIKREHGVKDWGNLIGGHGGMLDRVDSLIFAAPIFYVIVRLVWAQ